MAEEDRPPPSPPHEGDEKTKQSLHFEKPSQKLSYLNVVRGFQQDPSSSSAPVTVSNLSSKVISWHSDLKPTSIHQGKPSISFKKSEKKTLIEKLNHVLIAKFTHGRPSIAILKKFFADVKLKGDYNFSIVDSKHVFLECGLFDDYVNIWMKGGWHIDGYPMRIFKWTDEFNPSLESAITPVWIHLPRLPLYFFDEDALVSIANAIGRPLKIDMNNINRIKLGCASICVEVDVSKPIVDGIWIHLVEDDNNVVCESFWQKVLYGHIPPFCSGCNHLGHQVVSCKRQKGESSEGSIDFNEKERRLNHAWNEKEIKHSNRTATIFRPKKVDTSATTNKGKIDNGFVEPTDKSKNPLQQASTQRLYQAHSVGKEEGEIFNESVVLGVHRQLDGADMELSAGNLLTRDVAAGDQVAQESAASPKGLAGLVAEGLQFTGILAENQNRKDNGRDWNSAGVYAAGQNSPATHDEEGLVEDLTLEEDAADCAGAAGAGFSAGALFTAAQHIASGQLNHDRGEKGLKQVESMLVRQIFKTAIQNSVVLSGEHDIELQHSSSGQIQQQQEVSSFGQVKLHKLVPAGDTTAGLETALGELCSGVAAAGGRVLLEASSGQDKKLAGGKKSKTDGAFGSAVKADLQTTAQVSDEKDPTAQQLHARISQELAAVDLTTKEKPESWANLVEKTEDEEWLLDHSLSVVSQNEDSDEEEQNGTLVALHKQVMGFKSLKEGQREFNIAAQEIRIEPAKGTRRVEQLEQTEIPDNKPNVAACNSVINRPGYFEHLPTFVEDCKRGLIQKDRKVVVGNNNPSLTQDAFSMFVDRMDRLRNKEPDEKGHVVTWSKIVSGSQKILAARSISPVGRSSEKMSKLRKRIEYLKFQEGKALGLATEQYNEVDEALNEDLREQVAYYKEQRHASSPQDSTEASPREMIADASQVEEQDRSSKKRRGRNRNRNRR